MLLCLNTSHFFLAHLTICGRKTLKRKRKQLNKDEILGNALLEALRTHQVTQVTILLYSRSSSHFINIFWNLYGQWLSILRDNQKIMIDLSSSSQVLIKSRARSTAFASAVKIEEQSVCALYLSDCLIKLHSLHVHLCQFLTNQYKFVKGPYNEFVAF